jgi:hypothetical protein
VAVYSLRPTPPEMTAASATTSATTTAASARILLKPAHRERSA